MDVTYEHRLTEVEERSKSNTKRINELNSQIDAVNRLATAVEVMATKQDGFGQSVERLDGKVDSLGDKVGALEAKPAKRWDSLVDKTIWAVAGAVIAFLLVQIGIGG